MVEANKPSNIAIGIDLGTTYSCVGVWLNDRVEIIANDQGNRTTPSYVGFTETERLVGDAAMNQVVRNPINTVFDAKRLIGRKFKDSTVQNDMTHWPFKVESGPDDKPLIAVEYQGKVKKFLPEEISSMILAKMKETAEAFLNKPVKDAVITVPTYFNDSQRQATKEAGVISGLNVLRILNEPTSAAIAYGLHKKGKDERNVLIFDLGGGTFDVSLLTIDDGVFEVKATSGDAHLGGEDFDNRLVEYCAAEFSRKNGVDIRDNSRAIRRLRTQCERAKKILSSSTQAKIEIDCLAESMDYTTVITRAQFEELCLPMFKQCIPLVESVLKDSGIPKDQIHDIVLVGGSTRIPKVVQLLSEFFEGQELNRSINPDEAVAYGAAIQANILINYVPEKHSILSCYESASLSLGIETAGGIMATVIRRYMPYPEKRSHIFTTYADNQPDVIIPVYEGVRPLVKDNYLLGTLKLDGIPPALRGVSPIEITFDIDEIGNITISAADKSTGIVSNIINTNEKRHSKDEIEKLVKDAEKYEAQDKEIWKKIAAKKALEDYCDFSRNTLLNDAEAKVKFDSEDVTKIETAVDETLKWVEFSPNAHAEEYESKLTNLKSIFNPIVAKLYGTDGSTEGNAGPKVPEVD